MMRFYETVRASSYSTARSMQTCALHENFEEGQTLLLQTVVQRVVKRAYFKKFLLDCNLSISSIKNKEDFAPFEKSA